MSAETYYESSYGFKLIIKCVEENTSQNAEGCYKDFQWSCVIYQFLIILCNYT